MKLSQKGRVLIRPPRAKDQAAFIAAAKRSRVLHGRWVYAPRTARRFAEYLERFTSDRHVGFLVVRREDNALVGIINVGEIVRGPLQSAYLGYYAFADHARSGLMREGMSLVLAYAFQRLKLHRLEANIQPDNRPSRRFIKKCGFVREGYSRRYLKLGGRWRDHERWAILAEDWRRQQKRRA